SNRSNSVNASAVAPANPPMTSPFPSRRTFLALALTMVWPIVTCPSPPITTLPFLRTVRMVVPCQLSERGDCLDALRASPWSKHSGGNAQIDSPERDDFYSNHPPALALCLSMIFSENRFPLFGIML